MRNGFLLAVASLMAAFAGPLSAQGPLVSDLTPVRTLQSQSLTDDKGAPATDISGTVCLPPRAAERACLFINDEDRFAQFAKLTESRVIAGERIKLIGQGASSSTIGVEPENAACSGGTATFKDLDGEAVAFAAPYFYVAGSHGCSRHSNKFRASSFILARVRVDDQGNQIGDTETTYRLSEALSMAQETGVFFGKDLNEADGLNIEGIAVIDEQLIVGLRAPVINSKAFLVSVDLELLFSPVSSRPMRHVRTIPLPLGPHVGVRDLAVISDRKLLVLTGPAQEQEEILSSFFLVDLTSPGSAIQLATLSPIVEDDARGKAEAVVVLDRNVDSLRVLVMFDGLPGGGPREYVIPLH